MTSAPILQTRRLTLRGHVMADLEPFWDFFQSPRATYVSAPKNKTHMWYGFASEVGSWDLVGHGGWAVCLKDGTFIGQVAIIHPPHFPEMEIGWILFEGHEGKGFAVEATQAVLDWAWANMSIDTLVSYIDRDNRRSIALAERLGAVADPKAETYDDEDVVYRHRRPA